MPKRCGCGDTCACVIEPGSGATVDGSGTPDHPYVIGVEATTLADKLVFDDGVTVDFTTTGPGTAGSQMRVTAEAKLALTQLSDVEAGPPNSGEVPVWQGNQWVYQVPPAPPAGTVNVSNGIGGTGAVATPLKALTSGVFGQAPLDLYGINVASAAPPIYIDEAGNLRSQPLSYEVSAKNATDPPNTYPLGPSVMTLPTAVATAGGWPLGVSGIVVTFRRRVSDATYATAQHWYRNPGAGTTPLMLVRVGNQNYASGSPGWTPWVAAGGMYSGLAPSNANTSLTTTAVTDITGATLTVPVVSTDSVYEVICTWDVTMLVATASAFLGRLSVGGTDQTAQAVWIPGTTASVNCRQPLTQTYRISGLASGNQVFKLTASCVTANQYRTASPHSQISVKQLA